MEKTVFIQATNTVKLSHGDVTTLETFILWDSYFFDLMSTEDHYFDDFIRKYFDYWKSEQYTSLGDKREYSTADITYHLETLDLWLDTKEQEGWNLELVLGE